MRLMALLGCALFVVAGCGGGGAGSAERTMQTGPQETEMRPTEPAATPTLSTLGAYETAPVCDTGNDSAALFPRWGILGGIPRDDAVTCTAIGCPPAGDTIFMAYMNHENDGTVSRMTEGMRAGTSPVTGNAVWNGDVAAYETAEVIAIGGTSVTAYTPVEGNARLESILRPRPLMLTSPTLTMAGRTFHGTDLSWRTASSGVEPQA